MPSLETKINAGDDAQIISLKAGNVLTAIGSASSVGSVSLVDPVLGGTNFLNTWGVGDSKLPIGTYASEQTFYVTCSAGSITIASKDASFDSIRRPGPAAISGASNFSESIRRYEALAKPLPSSVSNLSFNQSAGLSTSKFTATIQKEEEADFDAIRLVAVNRAANAIGAVTALVGTSEKAAAFGGNATALVAAPVVNGATYAALQGATDVNGFRSVTWSGATFGAIPAAITAQQVTLSDWTAKSSIPRADGGIRPFSLVRTFIDGTLTPLAFQASYSSSLQTPSSPMRGRIIQSSNTVGSDGVANPALASTAATLGIEVFPIFRYRNPVLSVWICGDSLAANDGLVADKISNWLTRACYDLSTPSRPVVPSNMGASSQTSKTFISITRTFLAAGVPAPSCLIIAPASVNDSGYDLNFQERHCSQAVEAIKLAVDYKIPYVIIYGLVPNDGINLSQDNIRKATNAKLKLIAQSAGVVYIDFPALGNGASPERYVQKYKFDNIHFNELGIEEVLAPTLRAALAPLV